MFNSRPRGSTLARPATLANTMRRRVERAVHDPHGASERFDPAFELVMICNVCGKAGTAPRAQVSEAIRAHVEEKHPHHDGSVAVHVLYPKQ